MPGPRQVTGFESRHPASVPDPFADPVIIFSTVGTRLMIPIFALKYPSTGDPAWIAETGYKAFQIL